MDDDRPPAADGVEACDSADVREHDAREPEPNTSPAMGAPAPVAPDLASKDDEAAAAAALAIPQATLGALPDEVLEVVFNCCDARTLMMTIPAVSRRWLGVCQMCPAAIDLTWAVRTVGYMTTCAITDAGLAGLVLRFPNLRHLGLSRCRNVADGGVEAVVAGCPNLRHLDLSRCENVTDGGLEAVAARCPNLQHLGLFCCKKVTDSGVEAVAAGCPNLQHLGLRLCINVTDVDAKALFPNAKVYQ